MYFINTLTWLSINIIARKHRYFLLGLHITDLRFLNLDQGFSFVNVVLKKFPEIWPFICFIETIFPRYTSCLNWDNCNIVKIMNFPVLWNVGFYYFEHVSWISPYFNRDFEVILTCFNMYKKWGNFFENVEIFFDLVLIWGTNAPAKKPVILPQIFTIKK